MTACCCGGSGNGSGGWSGGSGCNGVITTGSADGGGAVASIPAAVDGTIPEAAYDSAKALCIEGSKLRYMVMMTSISGWTIVSRWF